MSDGKPQRIDKAYSWEAPFAAHGLMHTVIANAAKRDPYAIDVLFLYMANMSWNSAMNVAETLGASDREGRGDRRLCHPADHLFRRLCLGDGALCRSRSCPTRPISSAGTASRCSTGRSRKPMVRPIPSASRWSSPTATCAPFQTVLLDLGARLGLPGMTNEDGTPRYPGGYPDYIVNHERAPASARLPAGAARTAVSTGAGAPNPEQLQRYIENGCHWFYELPDHMKYYRHANRDYLDWAAFFGFIGRADPIIFQLYLRALAEIPPGRAGPRRPFRRRSSIASASQRYFDPMPVLVSALRGDACSTQGHIRCMRSPSGRWRCIIPGARRMPGSARSSAATGSICSRARAAGAGLRRWRLGARRSRPMAASRCR